RLEPVMRQHMADLAKKHPAIARHRNIGLFGIVELRKNRAGEPLAPYNTQHPALARFTKAVLESGVYIIARWDNFMTNPPLSITEDELAEGFAAIDAALPILDAVVEESG
nr:aminotransferase class III-fold pyridoxal phosphate-dependent enzyme [Deltaproteobacteria bacterium]